MLGKGEGGWIKVRSKDESDEGDNVSVMLI